MERLWRRCQAAADQLGSGYKFLRRLENKLRLLYDQSMNELSADRKNLSKVTNRLGYGGKGLAPEEEFLQEYRAVTGTIRELFEHYLNSPLDS